MELKTYFAQDRNGSLIPSASVAVYLTGTTTLASGLTNVSGAPLSNPFTADADGKIQFRAPDGIYDMQVSLGSTTGVKVTFQCVDVEQQLSDANSAADRAEDALADFEAQSGNLVAKDENGKIPLSTIPDAVMMESELAQPDALKLIGEVASIAELRTTEPTTAGQKIKLRSYIAGKNKGGGEFYYDNTDTTSADNGGTIIVTAGGKRWRRVMTSTVFHIHMFGALTDGETDDSDAINRTIAALPYNTWINSLQIPRINHEYSAFWVDGCGGIALVKKQIVLHGGVNTRNLTLRADTSVDWDGKSVLTTDGNRYWGHAKNIIIDGNHAKCKGITVSNAFGALWSFIETHNTQLEPFTNSAPGYEFFLTNARFTLSGAGKQAGETYQDKVAGMNITAGDGHYSDIATLFCPVGVYNAGSNFFSKVHPWSGYYNNGFAGQLEMRIGFYDVAGNSHYSDCYADSPSKKDYSLSNSYSVDGMPNGGVGFYFKNGAWGSKLSNCCCVVNSALYEACTDGRAALTDQLRSWFVETNVRNLDITDFRQPVVKTYIGDPIYADIGSRNGTTVIGADRLTNQVFSRIANQEVLRVSQEISGITKMISLFLAGQEVGSIDATDNTTVRIQAAGKLVLTSASQAGIEYVNNAGTPTLRGQQANVVALGDTTYPFKSLTVQSAPVVTSDERMKTDISDIPQQLLDYVMSTPMKQFRLKYDDSKIQYGVIISPEFIDELSQHIDISDTEAFINTELAEPNEFGMTDIWMFRPDVWQNLMLEAIRRKLVN